MYGKTEEIYPCNTHETISERDFEEKVGECEEDEDDSNNSESQSFCPRLCSHR
jgi:hypothetical protein